MANQVDYLAGGVPVHSASDHRCHILLPDVCLGDEDEVAGVKKKNHRGVERRSLRSDWSNKLKGKAYADARRGAPPKLIYGLSTLFY